MKLLALLHGVRSRPVTIWAVSSVTALVNRLIYTLTIACIPDLLQKTMGVSRASNGIVTAAFGIGGLVAGPLTGYISDRTQNRVGAQLVASVLYVVAGIVLYFAEEFYQIVVFRLVLGVASSMADTMLFTTVADVYPADLLGLKMAVIFVFDNIGNMLGPVLGGKTYERTGVGGVAIIAMALGAIEVMVVLVLVRNSLDIRQDMEDARQATWDRTEASAYVPSCPEDSSESSGSLRRSSADSEKIQLKAERGDTNANMYLWRLLLRLPVVGPTVAIFVGTGMQTVIETILPLRLFDRFGDSPAAIGIAFMIVGGVLILAMPAVGFANDSMASRYGMLMRYYTMAAGMLCVFLSQIVMSLAPSYAVLVTGYSLFAVSSMLVIVPAQSAFGEFVNASGTHAMAQCYSLAWFAEGLANISLPPVASALYASVGFLVMLMSMSAVLCTVCALAALAYPLKQYWTKRRSRSP